MARRNNFSRYAITALLIISLSAISLSACTGSEQNSAQDGSAASDAPADAADGGTVSGEAASEHEPITIMDAQRDYRALIELVHEYYPEINVEILPYRGRNMSAYCKQQLETGIMPDIYSTTQAWDETYQKEYLIDLSGYHLAELYNGARLSEYIVDGGLYLLPFDFSITGILCNKSLLERNGIEVPTTFAELRDVTIPALNDKGIKVSDCLLDLPGSAFQYFFNACSSVYMNSVDGRTWRKGFSDVESDTWAGSDEGVKKSMEYFQEWIDCGMISYDDVSASYTSVVENFTAGNTAFLVGTVKRFTQNEDGSGDEYVIIPWLSEDGESNTYITSPTRLYGLNKELAEPGNEQKLEDALHFLEVLSSNEGYLALNGTESTNMCSIADFIVSENSPYYEAAQRVSKGYAMNQVYTGWDNYLVPFGEAVLDWIQGGITAEDAIAVLDETKTELKSKGTTYYATVTEELDTVEAAQLSGQMFLEATGADAALISYNVYKPEVAALMENSLGANGHILPGNMSAEYITIFLPTGWYDTLMTGEFTGSEIMEMFEKGCDTRGTGYRYPYVLLSADGNALESDKTYKVVICGYDKGTEETLGLVDTGIVGLDAAKDYLTRVGTVSKQTLESDKLLGVTPAE